MSTFQSERYFHTWSFIMKFETNDLLQQLDESKNHLTIVTVGNVDENCKLVKKLLNYAPKLLAILIAIE